MNEESKWVAMGGQIEGMNKWIDGIKIWDRWVFGWMDGLNEEQERLKEQLSGFNRVNE